MAIRVIANSYSRKFLGDIGRRILERMRISPVNASCLEQGSILEFQEMHGIKAVVSVGKTEDIFVREMDFKNVEVCLPGRQYWPRYGTCIPLPECLDSAVQESVTDDEWKFILNLYDARLPLHHAAKLLNRSEKMLLQWIRNVCQEPKTPRNTALLEAVYGDLNEPKYLMIDIRGLAVWVLFDDIFSKVTQD